MIESDHFDEGRAFAAEAERTFEHVLQQYVGDYDRRVRELMNGGMTADAAGRAALGESEENGRQMRAALADAMLAIDGGWIAQDRDGGGFLEEFGAKVVVSEPGLIRVLLRESAPPPDKPKGGLFAWLGRMALPEEPAVPLPDPIEVDLQMEQPDLAMNRLQIIVVCRPAEPNNLRDAEGFKVRCNQIHADLRAYLMAKE